VPYFADAQLGVLAGCLARRKVATSAWVNIVFGGSTIRALVGGIRSVDMGCLAFSDEAFEIADMPL
jgi:hypothetical protein